MPESFGTRDLGDVPKLAELVGYQLHLTSLAVLRDAREALAVLGTTPAQVTAVAFVRDNPGCDQSSLGRFLAVNRSAAMKMVDRLADSDWVERRAGRDRRSNGLHLTAEGRVFLDQVLARLGQVDAALTENFSHEEVAILLTLLARLRAAAGHEFGTAASDLEPEDIKHPHRR